MARDDAWPMPAHAPALNPMQAGTHPNAQRPVRVVPDRERESLMHRHFTTIALAAGLLVAGGAQASDMHGHHMQCSFNSDYDVQIKADGIAFRRDGDHPYEIFMHDGQLRVDGHAVAVSAQDAARLRSYEQQVRDLLPAMAGIARDGIDIGYSAMTT